MPASATVVTPIAKREAVGIQAAVARIGISLAGSGEDVHVDIDQARRDVETGDVDYFESFGGIDSRSDSRDLAVADGDVAHGVDVVLGVDDAAALQKQIIGLGKGAGRQAE